MLGFYLQQSSSEDPGFAVGPRCMNAFREAGSFSPSLPPSHALSQSRTDLGEVCLLAVLSMLSCPYMLPRIKTKGRSCYRLQMHQNVIGTTQTMGSRGNQRSGEQGTLEGTWLSKRGAAEMKGVSPAFSTGSAVGASILSSKKAPNSLERSGQEGQGQKRVTGASAIICWPQAQALLVPRSCTDLNLLKQLQQNDSSIVIITIIIIKDKHIHTPVK